MLRDKCLPPQASLRTDAEIRLFIVEDHPSLRESLCLYFEMQADFTLCGSAESGEEALQEIEHCHPTVVSVDLSLPMMNGIEVISHLRQQHPSMKCVILSAHNEPLYANQARQAGAAGYILKGEPRELSNCIRKVVSGGSCFAEELEID